MITLGLGGVQDTSWSTTQEVADTQAYVTVVEDSLRLAGALKSGLRPHLLSFDTVDPKPSS